MLLLILLICLQLSKKKNAISKIKKKAFTNVEYIKLKPVGLSHNSKSYKNKNARSSAPVLPTSVYTCIHIVNCKVKSYINGNTWSRTCALIPLCSSCDFYVNWKKFSNARKTIGMNYPNVQYSCHIP